MAPALKETASIKEPSCPWPHDVSTVLPEHTPQCMDTTARSTRFGAEVRVKGRVNATISGRTNATSKSSANHMVSTKVSSDLVHPKASPSRTLAHGGYYPRTRSLCKFLPMMDVKTLSGAAELYREGPHARSVRRGAPVAERAPAG